MNSNSHLHNDLQVISVSAIFGALSAILTFVPALRFPLLPYLRFELAELPVMVATFLYGPIPGIVSSFSYWIILNFIGEFQPFGPAMKFLSVLGMIVGLWMGVWIMKKLGVKLSLVYTLGLCLTLAAILRIILMSVSNYLLLLILMPDFFGFASASLEAALGLKFSSSMDAIIMIMVFTAIFNLIHTLISCLPAYSVLKIVSLRKSVMKTRKPWISSTVLDESKKG
ncbi:MAG: hypothetical protein QXJ17_02925 [Nitrososphaeria archaeon]